MIWYRAYMSLAIFYCGDAKSLGRVCERGRY